MITLHLEAETLAELKDMACIVLGITLRDRLPLGAMRRPQPVAAEPEPQEPSVQSDKPRRPHRRVRPVEAPVAAPMAPLALEPDPLEEAFDTLDAAIERLGGDPEDIVDESGGDHLDAVQNELLKREVISSLSDMFTAGNVKVVRHVLHKYGRGAKSFPEIDPAHFPEIKAALDRNEAA